MSAVFDTASAFPSGGPAAPPHGVRALYDAHHDWLLGLLRRRLGNAFDAADLAHDAFVRLIVAPRVFDTAAGARAYLGSVARGLCVDLWRRREIERAWLDALARQPERTAPSAEAHALVIEALCAIDAMLAELPAKTARIFVMALALGMTDAEIAHREGIGDRMVRKHTARAMLHCALREPVDVEVAGAPVAAGV